MSMYESDHVDPTSELNLETVKRRAVKGVAALSGRHFLQYGITFVAQIFLGAFLSLQEWGIFAVVSAVVNFLVYFSDVGLAASLIQKKEKVTVKDLRTTFTVQQTLVLSLIAVLLLVSPYIKSAYNLSSEAMYLLYALGASFFLSSLKTIPSVLLERKIKFERLALASILETIAFNFILVFLAYRGFGISSFTWAVLTRGVVGLIALYALQPWMPGFAFSKGSLRKLLSFGVPYQVNTLIAVLKDDGIIIVLGRILGLDAMGILTWSQKWAQMPLRLFMDHVTKVTFPAFSRMQDRKAELEKSVTKSVFFISFLVFPTLIGFLVLAPSLIEIVPRYEKWRAAIVPLSLVGVNVMFAAVTTQLTNLLNAIGKIKTTFKLMIMWAALTWILVPLSAYRFGVIGAALSYALVGSSSVIAIYIVKRLVDFSLWRGVGQTFVSTVLMGALLLLVRSFLPVSIASVLVMIISGGLVYMTSIYLFIGQGLVSDVKKISKAFFTK